MFKKPIKGDFNYLNKKRKRVILLTVIYFALSLLIILGGYLLTGTKRNLMTVVGILGCLPACKSAVNMIMYIRAKGCPEEVFNTINPLCNNLISMYDMYFTSYKKNYSILHMVVSENVIIGYYDCENFDVKGCVDHLETMLKQAGHTKVTITLTTDMDKYAKMLSAMNEKIIDDQKMAKDDEIRISLYEISL